MREYNLVSLFAGIGGFEVGFRRAGFNIKASVEIDKYCKKLLEREFPNTAILSDIRDIKSNDLPKCDVITLGFPCQDLSVAGRREGLSGERSGLYYAATRLIDDTRPMFAIFENVPGLLSSKNGHDFRAVLTEMDRIGYNGAWRVFNSEYFGVPQRRRRVFGVFTRGDFGAECCAEILSIAQGMQGHSPPVRAVYGNSACFTPSSFGAYREGVGTLRASGGDFGGGSENLVIGSYRNLKVDTFRQVDFGDYIQDNIASTIKARDYKVSTDLIVGADSSGGVMCVNDHGGSFIGTGSDVAATIKPDAAHSPKIIQGYAVRRLTPREHERLQGFQYRLPADTELGAWKDSLDRWWSKDWTAGFSDTRRYKMLGNAVTVNVVEWIAAGVRSALYCYNR